MKRISVSIFCIICLFIIAAPSGNAVSIPGIDLFGGLMFMGNSEADGAPSPLLGYWGVGMPVDIDDRMSFGPELSMFSTQYRLTGDRTKAVPTEIEFADSLWMISLLLDTSFRYLFRVSDTVKLGPSAHLGFHFRIPVIGWGLAGGGSSDPDYGTGIVSYFYSQFRFFLPGVGLRLHWEVFERMTFLFRLAGHFPVFHLWDGEGAAVFDQMLVSGTVGLRFLFR